MSLLGGRQLQHVAHRDQLVAGMRLQHVRHRAVCAEGAGGTTQGRIGCQAVVRYVCMLNQY